MSAKISSHGSAAIDSSDHEKEEVSQLEQVPTNNVEDNSKNETRTEGSYRKTS